MKRTLSILGAAVALSCISAHATVIPAKLVGLSNGGNVETAIMQQSGQISGIGSDILRIDNVNREQTSAIQKNTADIQKQSAALDAERNRAWKEEQTQWNEIQTKYTESAGKALEGEVRANKADQAITDRSQDRLVAQLHADTESKLAGKVGNDTFRADQVRQDAALKETAADLDSRIQSGKADQAKVNQSMASRADSTDQAIADMNARNNGKFASLGKQIDENHKKANAGTSTALAAAGIPQVLESQTFALGAATGGYEGEQALAVGFSARLSQSVVVKAAVGTDTQHGTGYNVGASVGW